MHRNNFIRSTLLAWLIFIGIDFLMHASILENLWAQEIESIKSSIDLAILIPIGYLSFLLLTVLVGFIFIRIYPQKTDLKKVFRFAFLFGGLFGISNLLAVYSYINLPLKHLVFFNLTYLIEIIAVVLVYNNTYYKYKIRRQTLIYLIYFISLIILGIVIQNII